MKKGIKACIIMGITAVVLLTCISVLYIIKDKEYKAFVESRTYPKNTVLYVNGMEMEAGGMTAGEAYSSYIANAEGIGNAAVQIGGEIHEINLDKYCQHSIHEKDFEGCIGDVSFIDYVLDKPVSYKFKDEYTYNGGAGGELEDLINSGMYKYMETNDAYFDADAMEVVPEVYGTEIIPQKASEMLENAVAEGRYEVSLDDLSLYVQPEITESDIMEKYKDVLKLLEWKAEYSVSDYVIRMSDYKDKITVNDDGTYKIDNSFLKQAVLELSKTIDNKYDSIKFKAKKDGEITVKGGTYGHIMKNSKEIDFLKEKLKNVESVSEREPAWLCRPLEDGRNPNDYIEVDISEQHVWHYAGGKLCCESDCVTGTAKLKRDTPTGAYYISEKIPGKYLVGEGYKTWVDRWMRLTNSGVGLHDAGWRKGFGGSIYKTNGSHGCVNLPKKYAYSLYDEVYVGILVVVHG